MTKNTRRQKSNRYTDDGTTFDIRYFNRELKLIIDELDEILSDCSNSEGSECGSINSAKSVYYIRRNRNDKTEFVDVIRKEQLRLEKMADIILEESDYNKQKK